MRFTLMVTGPAYGTQQASSALQFAKALLAEGHSLESVFFYREGSTTRISSRRPRVTNSIWCAPGNSFTTKTASRCISAWRLRCVAA